VDAVLLLQMVCENASNVKGKQKRIGIKGKERKEVIVNRSVLINILQSLAKGSNNMSELWTNNDERAGVELVINGIGEVYPSLSIADVSRITKERKVSQFHVQYDDGSTALKADFPLTSGKVHVLEYNEAKIS